MSWTKHIIESIEEAQSYATRNELWTYNNELTQYGFRRDHARSETETRRVNSTATPR